MDTRARVLVLVPRIVDIAGTTTAFYLRSRNICCRAAPPPPQSAHACLLHVVACRRPRLWETSAADLHSEQACMSGRCIRTADQLHCDGTQPVHRSLSRRIRFANIKFAAFLRHGASVPSLTTALPRAVPHPWSTPCPAPQFFISGSQQ